jgi:hypothetical protein
VNNYLAFHWKTFVQTPSAGGSEVGSLTSPLVFNNLLKRRIKSLLSFLFVLLGLRPKLWPRLPLLRNPLLPVSLLIQKLVLPLENQRLITTQTKILPSFLFPKPLLSVVVAKDWAKRTKVKRRLLLPLLVVVLLCSQSFSTLPHVPFRWMMLRSSFCLLMLVR